MVQYWNEEIIRVTFIFDNGTKYVCESTSNKDDKVIVSCNKRQMEQINYNNIFGGINSNNFEVTVFDINNNLDMMNKQSPYYSYMRKGVKLVAEISYDDGVTFNNYGTFYVTEWVNSYYDGLQDVVTINSSDRLNYILNSDMPKLSMYSGTTISSLLTETLYKLGIDKNKIKIDKSLNYNLDYGVSDNEKVGYFLNDVCQAMCAVMIINDDNDVLVVPAISGYGSEYNLDSKYIISKSSSNNVNNIYNKVKLRYYKNVGSGFGDILTVNEKLDREINSFHNLLFSDKALDITEIKVDADDASVLDNIDIIDFSGYQNGIDIDINNKSGSDCDVTINVIGRYIKTSECYVYSDIEYTDNTQVISYELTNEYVQTEADAQRLANDIAKYIELMDTKIIIDTIYTPKLTCGDVLIFNDEDLGLVGRYKVIECYTSHGDEYTNQLTLISLKDTLWNDKLSWNDSKSWLENFALSQS